METAFLSSVPDASTSRVSTAHSSAFHAKIRLSVSELVSNVNERWVTLHQSAFNDATQSGAAQTRCRSAFRLFGSISRLSVFCTCHLFSPINVSFVKCRRVILKCTFVELFKRFRFLSAFFVRNLCILIRSRHRWSCTVVLPRVRLRAEQIWNELEKMSCFHFTLEYKGIKIT